MCSFASRSLESAEELGSGLLLTAVEGVHLELYSYTPTGGCYIETPISLRFKHALINVKNTDHKCLLYAVAAVKYGHLIGRDKTRPSKYKTYISQFNTRNIEFPIRMSDIPKFENQNRLNLNIFILHGANMVKPLYVSKAEEYGERYNVLALNHSNSQRYHFVGITDLERLLMSQQKSSRFFHCEKCLGRFD